MYKNDKLQWTSISPDFGRFRTAKKLFLSHVRSLQHCSRSGNSSYAILQLRNNFFNYQQQIRREVWPTLRAAGLLLADLAEQGWAIRIRKGCVEVLSPQSTSPDPSQEKELVRRQELIKRDAQLSTPSVQKFIYDMERSRLFDDQFVSIFSLMRDGRELANKLREVAHHESNGNSLFSVVEPYLEFVDNRKRCKFTGMRLMDIWRYFRHTWTNQYTSVPGRTMMILVRDAAAPFHPVIGIAALSSPIILLNERDRWIGWHQQTYIEKLRTNGKARDAHWLANTVNTALDELYIQDFVRDGLFAKKELKQPTIELIQTLRQEGELQRKAHHRFVERSHFKSLKNTDKSTKRMWIDKAETHLFRSKRAYALADYLNARIVLNCHFNGTPTAEKLKDLVNTSDGRKVVTKIIRKAKADRVGIAMADISVCGAVAPYNSILGGKLVSMLVTSPEVVNEYKRRYKNATSVIASSMAGRAIKRPSNLVYLGTTSLYGATSSQYNRIRIPVEYIDNQSTEAAIEYSRLGKSESFGTSHYSGETVDALVSLVNHRKGGQRVNSIFGEGASPKLRKVREGLEALGGDSAALLKHGRQRIIYGIPLIENLQEYLLGMRKRPKYHLSLTTTDATKKISEWWIIRWLKMRIQREEVLDEVARHTLVAPNRHGSRVPIQNILQVPNVSSPDNDIVKR